MSEIYSQLELLYKECLANYSERSITFSEESVTSMYNNTKKILTELIDARYSQYLTVNIIDKHKSQFDDMVWQQIEIWLLQLTDMDDSFVYAYNHLATGINRKDGLAYLKVKDVSKNDLRLLLNNKSSSINNPQDELNIKAENENEADSLKRSYTGNIYVLTYILDCIVEGSNPHNFVGKKEELEKIGNSLMGRGRGNTFYKCYTRINDRVIKACKELEAFAFSMRIASIVNNADWEECVIDLSKNKEALNNYLKSKKIK